ncbi:ArfGap-domain-containing protein [Rhizopus microsporus var. microsporus]|uniref:ArfGap-domain-containing protein n=1 Tax=Rhizopus microsporus var. microsporus TaxID=86635 RepID=A0A1X0RFN2_RHIZD|nr:ArfGap-domain-containing protein [Rhizopus microsporus var. microsporus]
MQLLTNMEISEDGPLFRATIKHLESRTTVLKARVKRIIKAATTSLEARRQLAMADGEFMQTLQDIECVEPLMNHYLNDAWTKITEERQRLDAALSTQLLDPIKALYEQDIKMADLKKRQFEEESKEYYAVLAKYLKRKHVDEERQVARKLKFDLARFDYLGYLLDLHGGKKEHDILFCITDHIVREVKYFESIAQKVENTKPGLELLSKLLEDTSKQHALKIQARAAKRKEMENMLITEHLDKKRRPSNSECQAISSISCDTDQSSSSTNEDKFKGIRDLAHQANRGNALLGRKKEGFLFATSKPSKSSGFEVKHTTQAWHKYWCVVSGGQFYEYTNWKKQLEPHNNPIDLRFASVREARNSERRFCFEIITPKIRRLYQATSQEEAEQWMSTVQNSIEGVLNGTSSSTNFKDTFLSPSTSTPTSTSSSNKSHGSAKKKRSSRARSLSVVLRSVAPEKQVHDDTGKSLEVPSQPTATSLRSRWSSFHFGQTRKHLSFSIHSQARSIKTKSSMNSISSKYDSIPTAELLSMLREDESNHSCADCGAKDPDWCSLNLGVLLCIECSGIHRSLGTHISKVRSLKLDRACYTPEVVQFLRLMGNAQANTIWGHQTARVSPTDSHEAKLAYIQAKYVDRMFVDKENELARLFFQAIDEESISNASIALQLFNLASCKDESDEDDDDEIKEETSLELSRGIEDDKISIVIASA